jgi:PRTRC genetic system protein C
MSIEITKLTRKFVFNGADLPDPGEAFTPEEVKELYSNQYPDLSTAIINEPTVKGGVVTYTFTRNVGTKG